MYIFKRKLIYSIAYFFKQMISITGAVIYLGGVRDLHNLCRGVCLWGLQVVYE